MKIEITERDGLYVFAVAGDIDMYSAPDLHKRYLDLAMRPRQAAVVMDLLDVAYLDSSGVGVLMQILADTKKRNVRFCLCNVGGMVEKLLCLSRMNLVLPAERTLQEAILRARSA